MINSTSMKECSTWQQCALNELETTYEKNGHRQLDLVPLLIGLHYKNFPISVDYNVGQDALKNAVDVYESISKPELAASCFLKSGDFETAGLAFLVDPLSNLSK